MERIHSEIDSKVYNTIVTIVDKRIKEIKVTRKDFDHLTNEVHDLRSDFSELKGIMHEIAESHIRLANEQEETQKSMKNLAKEQEGTQKSMKNLARAQEETQKSMKNLARAQEESQKEIKNLIKVTGNLQEQVGGISNSIGYAIENDAYRALPDVLMKKYKIEIKERFLRKYIQYPDGRGDEVNIIGKGILNSKNILIIGEVKTKLKIKDIDDLLSTAARLQKIMNEEQFLIMVTHFALPDVIEYAEKKNIAVIYTYEL